MYPLHSAEILTARHSGPTSPCSTRFTARYSPRGRKTRSFTGPSCSCEATATVPAAYRCQRHPLLCQALAVLLLLQVNQLLVIRQATLILASSAPPTLHGPAWHQPLQHSLTTGHSHLFRNCTFLRPKSGLQQTPTHKHPHPRAFGPLRPSAPSGHSDSSWKFCNVLRPV